MCTILNHIFSVKLIWHRLKRGQHPNKVNSQISSRQDPSTARRFHPDFSTPPPDLIHLDLIHGPLGIRFRALARVDDNHSRPHSVPPFSPAWPFYIPLLRRSTPSSHRSRLSHEISSARQILFDLSVFSFSGTIASRIDRHTI